MKALFVLTFAIALVLSVSHAQALIISSITADKLSPGGDGRILIDIANDEEEDIQDVSLSLDLTNVPISSIGSSEDSIDEIDEDDSETFAFTLKASTTANPGDYKIPYTLTSSDSTLVKKGTIGVTIEASPDLEFTTTLETPVTGQKGKINLKIVNKGQSDARFVSVTVDPDGFTLLSENPLYIGSVNSDDFETASFDVLFNTLRPHFTGTVEYVDFDNRKIIKDLDIPLTVYTTQRATELGIIKKSNAGSYITILVVLIIVYFVWRSIKKRRRMKKSLENSINGK